MQSLDVFMSRLLTSVPGCPDPLAKQALLDSAIEFCEETSIVQVTSEPQDTVALTSVYDVDLPSQQRVSTTLKAWYGTKPLVPAATSQIDNILAFVESAGGETAEVGEPSAYYEIAPGQIAIYPVPQNSLVRGFSARVATKPTRNATSVDDVLYHDWAEAIVGGATARLAATPNQMFTNPVVASQGNAAFWKGVSSATNIARRGRVRTSMRVTVRGIT